MFWVDPVHFMHIYWAVLKKSCILYKLSTQKWESVSPLLLSTYTSMCDDPLWLAHLHLYDNKYSMLQLKPNNEFAFYFHFISNEMNYTPHHYILRIPWNEMTKKCMKSLKYEMSTCVKSLNEMHDEMHETNAWNEMSLWRNAPWNVWTMYGYLVLVFVGKAVHFHYLFPSIWWFCAVAFPST